MALVNYKKFSRKEALYMLKRLEFNRLSLEWDLEATKWVSQHDDEFICINAELVIIREAIDVLLKFMFLNGWHEEIVQAGIDLDSHQCIIIRYI